MIGLSNSYGNAQKKDSAIHSDQYIQDLVNSLGEKKTDFLDSIERAVMIENYIYTVSYSSIKMFNIDNAFEEVGSQELNPDYYSIWGYPLLETTDAEVAD